MHGALLAVTLLAGGGSFDPQAGFDSHAEAAAALQPMLQTGTLLFSSGDCLAVRIYTTSPYTHVAAVVVTNDGPPRIYDSTSGVGVRSLSLEQFLASQGPVEIHVHQPSRAFTEAESCDFAAYLEGQVGRPYAIQHHLTGRRCEGLHCAEYMTDALMEIDFVRAKAPARVSPASLREGIVGAGVYDGGVTVRLTRPEPQTPVASGLCEQLWLDTRNCCSQCCRKLSGWILCR